MSDTAPVWNLYINGPWRAPRNEQHDPAYDPSNGAVLAHVARADVEDTRAAIQAARNAFDNGP